MDQWSLVAIGDGVRPACMGLGLLCGPTPPIAQHATHVRAHERECSPPRICRRAHVRERVHSRFWPRCRPRRPSPACRTCASARAPISPTETRLGIAGDSPGVARGLPRADVGQEPRRTVAFSPNRRRIPGVMVVPAASKAPPAVVVVPAAPPTLTPAALAALLRIVRKAAAQQAAIPQRRAG